jgi:hypothetical protein
VDEPPPAPRAIPSWAPSLMSGVLFAGIYVVATLVFAMIGLWMNDVLSVTATDGRAGVVLRTWEGDDGPRNVAGYAEVRLDDGRVVRAKFDDELLASVRAGGRTHVWPMPEDPSLYYVAEELETTRTKAWVARLVMCILVPLCIVGAIASFLDVARERRLFARGVAVRGELIAVDVHRIRYRYRTSDGLELEGLAKGTEERWRAMGPKPRTGLRAWVLYAPERPKRSVLYSFGERAE